MEDNKELNEQAVKIINELLLKSEYEAVREIVLGSLLFMEEYAKGITPLYKAFLLENAHNVPKKSIKKWIEQAEKELEG